MTGVALAEVAPAEDGGFSGDRAGGPVAEQVGVGVGSSRVAVRAAFKERGERDRPGLEADQVGRAVVDLGSDQFVTPMKGLAALERAIVEDGAALSAELVNVAEQLGVGRGRTRGRARAGRTAAHVSSVGDPTESVAAGRDAGEGASVRDEMVKGQVAPTGRAAFRVEGAELAASADELDKAGAGRGGSGRSEHTPAGNLALSRERAGVVPPGVDDDLDEVGALGRLELGETDEVEIGFRIAGEQSVDLGLQRCVVDAPADGGPVHRDGTGVIWTEAEVAEGAGGNVMDERDVEAPTRDLTSLGQRADGSGAHHDPHGRIGTDRGAQEKRGEREGDKRQHDERRAGSCQDGGEGHLTYVHGDCGQGSGE